MPDYMCIHKLDLIFFLFEFNIFVGCGGLLHSKVSISASDVNRNTCFALGVSLFSFISRETLQTVTTLLSGLSVKVSALLCIPGAG